MSTGILAPVVLLAAIAAPDVPVIEPPLQPGPSREGPPVGFVTHPHAGRYEELAETAANAELANVFGWRMKDQENLVVDFGPATEWLREVYASGRAAYPIIDTAIHHSDNPWRAAMTAAAGENLVDAAGKTQNWSSLHSPLFRASVLRYADQLIDWVKANDTAHRIPGYLDGAEWFWPWFSYDYHPRALEAFRDWLRARYGSVEAVNAAWGADFAEWADVDPVRPYPIGCVSHGLRSFSLAGPMDVGWISEPVKVSPGTAYRASVQARRSGVPEGLCLLQFAWFDKEDRLLSIGSYGPVEENAWETVTGTERAPAAAANVRLAYKQIAPGDCRFRALSLVNLETGEEILPAAFDRAAEATAAWTFTEWAGKGRGAIEQEDGRAVFATAIEPQPLPYRHSGVAYEDWATFSFESMADWLDTCARHIKRRDPRRQVVSYVGFVFGFDSHWDYSMMQQRLDISLANSPAVEVNGIQLCIAGRDFTYASCPLDVARKYNKPMMATDLIDFPYGLYSGFEPIYRGTLACVQHGLDGLFAYCWYGTPDYNYSANISRPDLDRLLRDTRTAIETFAGYELSTRVAMLMPVMSYSLADEGGYKGDSLESGGLYRLVLDLGLVPDVWTPYELEKHGPRSLDDYDLVVVPDCPVLPPAVYGQLLSFVRRGGTVLGTGRTPLRDLAGNPCASGLAADQSERVVWFGEKLGRAYWGRVHRWNEAGNTPPVAMEVPDPERSEPRRRAMRKRMMDAIQAAGVAFPARIDVAPGNVHLAAYRHPERPDEQRLFLIHTGEGRCRDATVLLDKPGVEAEAWLDFDRRVPVAAGEDGRLALPDFAHCCVVDLRPAGG